MASPHRCGCLVFIVGLIHLTLGQNQSLLGSKKEPDADDAAVRYHWALLIAGSSGWGNYRHQADCSHAYHVLRSGGLQAAHIVTMMYDDIAYNPSNVIQGKIFNKPGGPDVYKDVVIDYKGEEVNSKTFLSVLLGDKKAVKGQGTGKVISSGPQDRVFLFYSDHGSPGVLGMPTGSFLYADHLISTLKKKHASQGYKEMVMYIEACESGSMFEGLLDPELNVYVTTASNANESSWGVYCPGMDPAPMDELDVCLGDLYSVSWMEESEMEDLTQETLQEQYERVRTRTSNNMSFAMGSHVMQYGQLGMRHEKAASFLGMQHRGNHLLPLDDSTSRWSVARRMAIAKDINAGSMTKAEDMSQRGIERGSTVQPSTSQKEWSEKSPKASRHHATVKQWEADLLHLRVKAARHGAGSAAQEVLDQAVARRAAIDEGLELAVRHLFTDTDVGYLLLANFADMTSSADGVHDDALTAADKYTALLLHHPTNEKGTPVVNSFDCLRSFVDSYLLACGTQEKEYIMRHTRLFSNLCNVGLTPDVLIETLRSSNACQIQS